MIPLTSLAFFVSGIAALLYQVIWQRLLVIFSGADLYSVTIIVAAFMCGLGLGNLAGGHVADRVSPRRGLLLFASAELAIALFGMFSANLYYGFLYVRFGATQIPATAMAGVLFVSLLWPTFFMGASLPLLARAMSRQLERAASTIGVLYGMNTLGAAVGALLSTWVLIPRLGLEGSLRVAVVLNVLCAALLVPAAFGLSGQVRLGNPSPATGAAGLDSRDGHSTLGLGWWAAAFALSGMLALSLEIVWFRILAVTMKSTAFTFGTLLWLYLTGIGAGSVIGSTFAPRLRRPALWFFTLQAAVAASALLLVAVLIRGVDDTSLWTYLGSYEPLNVRESVNWLSTAGRQILALTAMPATPRDFLIFYLAVPVLLVLPPTLLMGCSFPVLQRAVQTRTDTIGRRIGILLLANIFGSVVGTVVTGWLLLDWLGTAATLKLLGVVGGVFGAAAIMSADSPLRTGRRTRLRIPALVATGTVFAGLVAIMPGSGLLWAHLHGAREGEVVIGEDGSGLSVIKAGTQQAVVYVNGIGQSRMPYGEVHTALGALPAFLHPSPETAVVIGLGSGDTVHAVAGRQQIKRISSVEIIRGQLRTLEAVRERFAYPGLVTLLSDPRVQQVFADGRIFLQRGNQRYDIIEADALRPGSAYSGNLYSDAYFELVRNNLTPGGLAATWAPTQRVYNTFLRTFPHVVAAAGILIGSQQPIRVDLEEVRARLAEPFSRSHFDRAGIDIGRLMSESLESAVVYGPEFSRETLTDINTDLFPRDEFDLSPADSSPEGRLNR